MTIALASVPAWAGLVSDIIGSSIAVPAGGVLKALVIVTSDHGSGANFNKDMLAEAFAITTKAAFTDAPAALPKPGWTPSDQTIVEK